MGQIAQPVFIVCVCVESISNPDYTVGALT